MEPTHNWKAWLSQAKSKTNAELAIKIAQWLTKSDYGCALIESGDGVVTITYADKKGEGHIGPSIQVYNGKVRFPAGTPPEPFWETCNGVYVT